MNADQTFRVAKVVYFTDLTRAGSRVIPLGSLAEVRLSRIRGLALKARTALKPDEVALVTPLIRDKLADPFVFLKVEFDLAWNNAPAGKALEFLGKRHASSLSVLAPTDYSERHWLLGRLLHPRGEAVDGKLSDAIDSEFAELLKQYGDQVDADQKVIESSRRAA
jgi:hypothetical protein